MGAERRPARLARLAAAGLASAVLLAGCGGDEQAPFSGTVLDNPYTVPTTELVDTGGDPFSLADDTDKRLTMVFFGYVNCVDICPAVLTNLASAMTRLDDDDRDQVEVVMVTSDPDTDTPESLRAYLDRFDTSFVGLDSDFETIRTVGSRAGRRHRREGPRRPHHPGHGRRHRRRVPGLLERRHQPVGVRQRHPHPPRGLT